jgi:SAM-dependent methyltransferase
VIDLGCGSGTTLQRIGSEVKQAFGVDRSHAQAKSCIANGIPAVQAAAEMLPLPSDLADGIFAECVLSILDDDRLALAEIYRVLRPDGKLIISDLYFRNEDGAADIRALAGGPAFKLKTQAEMMDLLRGAGLTLEIWEDLSSVLQQAPGQRNLHSGPPADFWRKKLRIDGKSQPVDPFDFQLAVSRAKPGYYLAIAGKIDSFSSFF